MTKEKVSFNEDVKTEICNLTFDKQSSYYVLLSLFINLLQIKIKENKQSYVLVTQYPQLIRLIKKLLSNLGSQYKTKLLISTTKIINNKKNFMLEIDNKNNVFDKLFNIYEFDPKVLDNNTKKRSFILGAYLSHGSISFSITKSSYHFEINSHKKWYLEIIQQLLNEYQIISKLIPYKELYKLYFKKAEYISDILKLFNVIDNLYKFEDFRIRKDFSNSLQRLNNLEVSNINKTIIASLKQKEQIIKLKEKKLFNLLSDKEKLFCEIRLNNPEASLNEISLIFKNEHNINIARTSLNHFVRKIDNLYKTKIEN